VSAGAGLRLPLRLLGLLHLDIVQERLEREYDMDLITTAPPSSTRSSCATARSEIENPSKLPDLSRVEEIREPVITATILMHRSTWAR